MPMLEMFGQTAQRKHFRAVLTKFFETDDCAHGDAVMVSYFKYFGNIQIGFGTTISCDKKEINFRMFDGPSSSAQ